MNSSFCSETGTSAFLNNRKTLLRLVVLTIVFFLYTIATSMVQAQGLGTVQGRVFDAASQEPLIGATVTVEGTTVGATTDVEGRYTLRDVPTGVQALRTRYIGYKPKVQFEIRVERGVATVDFAMEAASDTLSEVEIVASAFSKTPLTLISSKQIGAEQIRSNPGGNFDVSRVIQSLPGVSGAVGFRNDIIVRGGAPNENVFFLDGIIEAPAINHFPTQGSGGGPTGIINSALIQNLSFQSGNFGAQYDNALSSVFDFDITPGNRDRLSARAIVSATEAGITLDGPLRKDGSLTGLISVRRSYLQVLFKAIGLPFLPDYWDATAKLQWQINPNTTLSYVFIGGLDNLTKNLPDDPTLEERTIFNQVPRIDYHTWTHGLALKRLTTNGYYTLGLSQNVQENRYVFDLDEDPSQNRLRFLNREQELRLRLNVVNNLGGWRLQYGAVAVRGDFRNSLFNVAGPGDTNRAESKDAILRFGVHASLSRNYFSDRLKTTLGIRSDINDFTDNGDNPLRTLSPRASFSYALTDKWNLNGNVGIYYKLPPYVILGWGNDGELPNRDAKYWQTTHFVLGVDYNPNPSSIISVEAFVKLYDDYSVSVRDSISVSNTGGNFGLFGNERVLPIGRGRSYGVEIYGQKRLTNRVYGIASLTVYRAEFTGFDRDEYIRSSWDNRYLLSLTGGYQFGASKQWEVAAKWRLAGALPYTPYRTDAAALAYYADRGGDGLLDYSRVNEAETNLFSQLDVRLERKFNFAKWSLAVFADVQNVLNRFNESPPNFTLQRNPDGSFATPFTPVFLRQDQTSLLPSIGIIARI